MGWEVRVTHDRDVWDVVFRDEVVGKVVWIADLRHPMLTKGRIADGLNGEHTDAPSRCWSAELAVEHRWNLRHNNLVRGEVAWERPPRDERRWIDRILQGLNWVPASRAFTPAEPAPTPGRAA